MQPDADKSRTVLVIGGGVAGMQAALDAAGLGARVRLVEKAGALGGIAAQVGASPAGCGGVLVDDLIGRVNEHGGIQVSLSARVASVAGRAGDFAVTVRRQAHADTAHFSGTPEETPQAPAACEPGCPDASVSDAENTGLEKEPGAEEPAAAPAEIEDTFGAGAIIVATGLDTYAAARAGEYGCGRYRNVITSVDLARMLRSAGGESVPIARPSDGAAPSRVAFIHCAGSRSVAPGANPWCSSVCCMTAARQAREIKTRSPKTDVAVFHGDLRTCGKGQERYRDAVQSEYGVRYLRSLPGTLKELKQSGNLILRYVDEGGNVHNEEFDLVVLAIGTQPRADAAEVAAVLCVERGRDGFLQTVKTSPVELSRQGVFAAGAAVEPKNAVESIVAGSAAAVKAVESLHDAGLSSTACDKRALVVGGTVAGMTAALALARLGVDVTLVEKDATPGGSGGFLLESAGGLDLRAFIKSLTGSVSGERRIEVLAESEVVSSSGNAGAFESIVRTPSGDRTVRHQATILAAGASEYRPSEYLHGQAPRVVTQREFGAALVSGKLPDAGVAGGVVMIQCVGSRDSERPWCSRTCCIEAVGNALEVRRRFPHAPVCILHRDVRTFGTGETLYREARLAGVRFIRYSPERRPVVAVEDGRVSVSVFDCDLRDRVKMGASCVVLSAGVVPGSDTQALSRLFGIGTDEDGFLAAADNLWRPVDSPAEGIYICATARGPVSLDEAVMEGLAAAGRAALALRGNPAVDAGDSLSRGHDA